MVILVDHEPPVRIETELSNQGIHFARGDKVALFDPSTGAVDLVHTPDDLDFDIDDFNRKVITRPFNRVICKNSQTASIPRCPAKP